MENQSNSSVSRNKLAIWAFILSILGGFGFFFSSGLINPLIILLSFILSVSGVVMGIIALVQIAKAKQKGKVLAILSIIGIILWPFIFGLIFGIASVVFITPSLNKEIQKTKEAGGYIQTIESITPTAGPVGMIITLRISQPGGYHSFEALYMENSNGDTIEVTSLNGGIYSGFYATTEEKWSVTQRAYTYTAKIPQYHFCNDGSLCDIAPGVYKIYTLNSFKQRSNSVEFTVTNDDLSNLPVADQLSKITPSSGPIGTVVEIEIEKPLLGSLNIERSDGKTTLLAYSFVTKPSGTIIKTTIKESCSPDSTECEYIGFTPGIYKIYLTDFQNNRSNIVQFTITP